MARKTSLNLMCTMYVPCVLSEVLEGSLSNGLDYRLGPKDSEPLANQGLRAVHGPWPALVRARPDQ